MKYTEHFVQFLKDNDALDDYMTEVRKQTGLYFKGLLNKYKEEPSGVIYHTLAWSDSTDEQEAEKNYWRLLDRKWFYLCRENNWK